MSNRITMPVAVHLILTRGDEVLLLRRFQTGYEDGHYSVPAGHLDGDEEVVTAAIREAREECSIVVEPADVRVIGVMHRKSTDERIDFFVRVARWTGDVRNGEPHKCDELAWYPIHRLPENVIPYVRRALEHPQAGIWFESVGFT
ncbi:NUDIX domain-containing protein [Pendulispora rubella]|uniref:NUDIX domain-containing protein n=1 Tax=Pendulispora rubella TaxID=2741070 RepID=A0ABZ2L2T4_9BACT